MLHILCFIIALSVSAQQEFHVYPVDDLETPGSIEGDGTLAKPWDLQTALSQKSTVVKAGDIIWIHQGTYNGRYVSTLQSNTPNKYITVSSFKDDKVVINGNVDSHLGSVLVIKSKQVIFKNFQITWLGDFSRDEKETGFKSCIGVEHLTGENCKFYNLIIHNVPGLGFGSWKNTAGTVIENCMIFNNGYIAKNGNGIGEGMYIQNKSDEVRLIKNNIIFNNYYKGIEVWSAGKRANYEFVKNITLENNIVFNSGSPAGRFRDNLIIASNDRNGINMAKNITVLNNVFYHNTSGANGSILGDAPSLTLGFSKFAPIENVVIDGNIITGGYNALRILLAKSMHFRNNTVYTGNIQVDPTISKYFKTWQFSSNTFYSNLKKPFRVTKVKDYALQNWNNDFKLDDRSTHLKLSNFDLPKILHLSQHSQNNNNFTLALFDVNNNDVTVDFSNYNFGNELTYKIYDVENPDVILNTGKLSNDNKVVFAMNNKVIERPRHNTKAEKTLSNFGVFIIKFEEYVAVETTTEKKENAVKRFFKWLGF
nr:right-handed parallel beta-helix repeat-containing protein [uncultured Psychroserpens sp.]